jgi:putative transposase
MKYKFLKDHGDEMPVRSLCQLLSVAPSAYYRRQQLGPSNREQQNQQLLPMIREIHQQSRRTYGSPRVWDALHQRGIPCSRKRIARLMRLDGIRAKTMRRFKITTRARSGQGIAPDLVRQRFTAPAPNRIWTTDITYLWTREGWAYLAVVLDLYSRMIVAWELSSRLSASLVTSAVERAIHTRKPSEGLILHSDRGSQYGSDQLRQLAKEQKLQLSMGRTGNCYDNAVTESFFHTLKTEHVYFSHFETRQDARISLFDYIETFYNTQRIHSTIGNVSPMQFESQCIIS